MGLEVDLDDALRSWTFRSGLKPHYEDEPVMLTAYESGFPGYTEVSALVPEHFAVEGLRASVFNDRDSLNHSRNGAWSGFTIDWSTEGPRKVGVACRVPTEYAPAVFERWRRILQLPDLK